MSALGMDDAEFFISVNPGEPPKPLGTTVSGGELSRILLAIKTVLADKEDTPTLIFDEIDSGISGITAGKVAEKTAYHRTEASGDLYHPSSADCGSCRCSLSDSKSRRIKTTTKNRHFSVG